MATNEGFQATLWSVVLRAKDPEDPHRKTALNRLCETYWKPVYAWLRRRGLSREDAEDAAQGFFSHLLEKELLERLEQGRGRFRSYLLAVLEHYLANDRRVAGAEKRGGGRAPLSLDFARAESELRLEPAETQTPEDVFFRSWGTTLLQNAFVALRRELEAKGLRGHFDAIRAHLSAADDRASYETLAGRLDCSVADVTNLLHRSKKRLRELLREAVRDTVESDDEIETELREIFCSL